MQRSAALRVPQTHGDEGRVSMFIPEEGKAITKAQGCIGHELAKGGYIVDQAGQKIEPAPKHVLQFLGAKELTIMTVIDPGDDFDFCVDPAAPAHACIVYKPRKP